MERLSADDKITLSDLRFQKAVDMAEKFLASAETLRSELTNELKLKVT